MRVLAALILGAAVGLGAVAALVHDQSAVTPAPVKALFGNVVPYSPQGQYASAPSPSATTPYNYGSGG
jgi:hypothetical protein